jgi:hypothetical protein
MGSGRLQEKNLHKRLVRKSSIDKKLDSRGDKATISQKSWSEHLDRKIFVSARGGP